MEDTRHGVSRSGAMPPDTAPAHPERSLTSGGGRAGVGAKHIACSSQCEAHHPENDCGSKTRTATQEICERPIIVDATGTHEAFWRSVANRVPSQHLPTFTSVARGLGGAASKD